VLRKSLMIFGLFATLFVAAPLMRADGLLVGQCFEFTVCWTGSTPTPWSDSLSAADLANVEAAAGSAIVPFIVEQNAESVIRLGRTTVTFATIGGPVTESLGEFNGLASHTDPCPTALPYCETDTVGTFSVPTGALSAVISGTFGNSTVSNSAGECLYLGATGPCSLTQTPEPGSVSLLFTLISGVGLVVVKKRLRRRSA
jgi:hypothetical protein